MIHSVYLMWAQRASEKEQKKQWVEASDLWKKAFNKTCVGDKNRHWAWARAEHCNLRTDKHDWYW